MGKIVLKIDVSSKSVLTLSNVIVYVRSKGQEKISPITIHTKAKLYQNCFKCIPIQLNLKCSTYRQVKIPTLPKYSQYTRDNKLSKQYKKQENNSTHIGFDKGI